MSAGERAAEPHPSDRYAGRVVLGSMAGAVVSLNLAHAAGDGRWVDTVVVSTIAGPFVGAVVGVGLLVLLALLGR